MNVFAWATLATPMMSSLALLWIAVEVTTVISPLVVATLHLGFTTGTLAILAACLP